VIVRKQKDSDTALGYHFLEEHFKNVFIDTYNYNHNYPTVFNYTDPSKTVGVKWKIQY
jgi:hypothetical protein